MLPLRSTIAVSALLLTTSCVFLEVGRQQTRIERLARISGTVTTENPARGALVVALIRLDLDPHTLVDHSTATNDPDQPAPWVFVPEPGRYGVAAFEDLNGDLNYDPGEPIRRAVDGPVFDLGPGEHRAGIEVVIPAVGPAASDAPVDIAALQARTREQQLSKSLGQWLVRGEVVDLDDVRFDPRNAKRGLWRPLDFMIHVGPGFYFLESYDPDRVPVLFVHGVNGHPREFTTLVEALDRSRFQPWVFFYPSGIRLGDLGRVFANLVQDLRGRHGFEELVVVAHSMGGLVARAGILEYGALSAHATIRLFVSIATPWAGHAAAKTGVERAPKVVYSWFDMAPGSDFLHGLFLHDDDRPRLLPGDVPHHLLFGFIPGKGDDGVVSVASQLRWEAQREARRLYGLPYDHAAILRAAETSSLLAEILMRTHEAD